MQEDQINMVENFGPTLPISEETHQAKYRGRGESFKDAMARIANTLADNDEHFVEFSEILWDMRFLPAGRIQAAVGSPRRVTAFNCFVSSTIEDSMEGIADAAKEAAVTMKMGGGIGFDFSTLRPRHSHITTLDSKSSGAVSFMQVFDAWCGTVSSAGNRRGAMMAVIRIDHPDIEEFIEAKTNDYNLRNFNLSVGVTDKFMQAVEAGDMFELCFGGEVHSTVDARYLWEKLMRATWDWAEPGILFIDRINEMNNLYYCEHIAASNPCGR
jgi:ribonucleoside-diphosphate reductase alpha chain